MLDNFESKPLTTEENDSLAVKVRAQDPQAREDLIVGNIPLVRHRVRSWVSLYPHLQYLQEDMVSEGLVGLVEAVNRIAKLPEPENNNVTGCLSVAITRAVGHYVAREEVEPKVSLPDYVAKTVEVRDPTEFVDFVDSLYGACDSDEHRMILQMRAEGASEKEVAAALDCSQQTVSVLLDEIRQNFEDSEE